MLPMSTWSSSLISSRVMSRRSKRGKRYSGVLIGSCVRSARYLRKCAMRSAFMGVAQRVQVREKVPFAARIRARVARCLGPEKICHLGDCSIVDFVGSIDDE